MTMVVPDDNKIPRGATSFYDFSQPDDGTAQPAPAAPTPAPADGSAQPAPPSSATPTFTGNRSSASGSNGGSTTTTTTTTTTQPYAQFKGNDYEELEKFIRQRMDDIHIETPEEKEKREKRERRTAFLARLADGLGTFHTAYSYARGVKPMDMPEMSKRAEERYEKAKAQRDKDRDRWVNYAITLGNLKDKDRDFNFRVTQAEQQQSNWQKGFDANRQDRADDVAYRDKTRGEDVAFRDKQFEEGKRQFGMNYKLQQAGQAEQSRHNRASEGLQRQQMQMQMTKDAQTTTFTTGDALVSIPNRALNQQTIAYIYSKTPTAGRPQGEPIIGRTGLPTGDYKPVSSDEMMNWIGENAGDANVQAAIRQVGGQSKKLRTLGLE